MSNLRDMIVSIAFKDNASKAVQEVNKSMDAAKKAFSSSSTSAMKTSDAVKDVGKAMKTASTETKRTNSGFKTTATTMKTVQSAFKRSNTDVTKLTGTFRTAGSAMKTVASSAKPISPELNRVQRAMKSVGDASKTAKTAIGSFATGGLNRLRGAAVTGVSRLANDFRALPGVVGGAARKVGSSITNFITAPLRGAVGMVQQYAGALGLLSGGALAASGMARLSAIENAKTSLSVMMGDAGKASKFMDEVLAFAKTTPFAFPDLAETARNLIAFGMDEAKVVPTMKAIGDAAAASGKGSEGLNQVASAFGDMQIAGYLGMDQINRLQAGGVPALKILANQFGITTDEMKKKISDGKVDSVKAIDQLVMGMQKGTKGVAGETAQMAGIMEETKKNWTGSVDSLKSSISSTMATLLEPVKPHIQNAMAWFGNAFSKLPTVVFGAFNAIKPAIDVVKPIFEEFMSDLKDRIGPMKEIFSELGSSVSSFVTDVIIPYLPQVKENFTNAFEAISPVVESVGSVLSDIGSVIMNLYENVVLPVIPILQNIITEAFTAIQPVISAVSMAISFVKDVIIFLVENVVVPLIPILSSVIQTAFDIVNPILRIAKSLFDAVWTVIEFLVTGIILPLIPGIADVFTGMWGILKPILDGMVSIFNGIADAIQWAVDKFKSFADAAKNFKMPKIGLPSFMGGNGLIQMGSHATGLGRVPYDEYPMFAHKDEAVLTAEQSNALRAAGMLKGDGVGPTLDMSRGSSSPVSTSTTSATHNNNTFHFHISGQNAEDIGRRVRDEIEALFGRMNAVTE